eukprot:sb/3470319/
MGPPGHWKDEIFLYPTQPRSSLYLIRNRRYERKHLARANRISTKLCAALRTFPENYVNLSNSKPLCLFTKGIRVNAFGIHPGGEKMLLLKKHVFYRRGIYKKRFASIMLLSCVYMGLSSVYAWSCYSQSIMRLLCVYKVILGWVCDARKRPCTKISFAPYILSIEIKFLVILRLEPESIGKMRFFSIQRNQDQVFILSGTGDMSENI